MTKQELEQRVELALSYHNKGYNCAQSVACAFSDQVHLTEEDLFRITEGLGLGMGGMDGTCGAISAAAVLSGLANSTAHLEHPDSKKQSYQASKACLDEFQELNGSTICRELRGADTQKVLRSCDGCIEDAARIVAKRLFP